MAKKLTDTAQNIDEWIAAYIVTHHLADANEFIIKPLCDIARAAFMFGYIRGSNAAMEIMKKK